MTDGAGMTQMDLGADYQDIRDGVRKVCEDYPLEYWREKDEIAEYPTEFVKAMTEAGYLGALIPEEYGGAGLPIRAGSVILEEIHANGSSAAACHAQMYIMGTLLRHGSEDQRRHYLPKIANGSLRLQAFGVTEPTTGTDTTQMKTMAVRRGDRYIVNGQKVWISRVEHSDLMLLVARTTPLEEVRKKTEGLSVLLVDLKDAIGNGMTVTPIRAMINHATTEVFFDNLEVPVENRIGEEGKGFRYLLDGLNPERILIAAEAVGIGRNAVDRAARYARERVVFGRPIGQNQAIQHPLARSWAELEAGWLLAMKAAWAYDAGQPSGAAANAAKYFASEAAFTACERAVMTHGGMGYAKEFQVERLLREVLIPRIAPVSQEMVLCYLAERVLDLPRSY